MESRYEVNRLDCFRCHEHVIVIQNVLDTAAGGGDDGDGFIQ